jgi:NAD(P)-dependent dehydrogenase (short-subunit alcohol dehydrogenase family)
MARIFITGSADGLGQLAARELVQLGHDVVLHARHEERARQAMAKVPGARAIVSGDLSRLSEVRKVAETANALGTFDAVIHNAGVYLASSEEVLLVNVLAPYALTCLMRKPGRLIYLGSGDHKAGRANLENLHKSHRVSYADSKLYLLMLGKSVARYWPAVYSNTVDPGWVPTKMGGSDAPDNLQQGYETQAWLAVSNEASTLVTGRYFYHKTESRYNTAADDLVLQDRLIAICEEFTGVSFQD